MSQAKANSQNIYAIVAVMDVRIRNIEPGPGKFERRILILALRIMTLRSCLDIFQGFRYWGGDPHELHVPPHNSCVPP